MLTVKNAGNKIVFIMFSLFFQEQIHIADFDNYATLLCGKHVPNQ